MLNIVTAATDLNRSGSIRLITYIAPAKISTALAMLTKVLLALFFCHVLMALVNCLKVPEMEFSGVCSIFFRLFIAFANCPMLNASSPTSIKLSRR